MSVQTAAAPAPSVTQVRSERQPLFDNAKFAAVALVVCAHTWMPLLEVNRTVAATVLTIAAFAMPVFVTLCGYFAQPRPGRPQVDGARLIGQIAVPYLIFQVLYNLVGMALEQRVQPIRLLEPRWLTWFLLSLLVWRLTVPIWTALRHPLPVAVLIAAGSGAVHAYPAELALGRTLSFLPWFVLGLVLRPHHFTALHHRTVRRIAPLGLLAAFAAIWLAAPKLLNPAWVEYTQSAEQLHVGYPVWLGVRAAFGLLSLVASASFLALLPARRTRYTALGAASLYVYLLHGLPLKLVQASGIYHARKLHHAYTALPLLGAFALTLAVVLSLPPVVRVLTPLVQPRLDWLLRSERSGKPLGLHREA
ncbi:acyltransferase family protein [Kitasatospora atroaurantiaca]|uniref:Fucose 4-O-acetylase-like acetyltransferase n=1 Tax=Kitasatospora atroaurantiaca TaxID=285545 RepID=A0A561EUB0_9ACTN|nr:acyltransferase family protein [Kitasatospora atroaurantiaca]TWE19195.1 fucose 4-O-acetylase-like acetyltransferase [Kitasatospora atroaurantiaca]